MPSTGLQTHISASLVSGFFATVAASPWDVLRSRMMAQRATRVSVVDVSLHMIRTEGPLAFWRGFVPNYLRIGPHVAIMFVVIEQLRAWANGSR
jgi:hypothetical protein